MYDLTRGKVSIKEWGKHFLRYYDGRFLEDSLFGLFLYNTVQRHSSNSDGTFFLHQTDLLEETRQPSRNCKDRSYKKTVATLTCCGILLEISKGVITTGVHERMT